MNSSCLFKLTNITLPVEDVGITGQNQPISDDPAACFKRARLICGGQDTPNSQSCVNPQNVGLA